MGENKINRGRKLFGLLFLLAMAVQVTIVVIYLIKIGPDKLSIQIFRIFLTAVFFGLTYFGSRLGKWGLVGFFIFTSVVGLGKIKSINDFEMIALVGVYIIASVLIIFNPHIANFLEEQKLKNIK